MNIKNAIRTALISILSAGILYLTPAQAKAASDDKNWEFNAAVYLWAADLNITTNSNAPDPNIPLGTIIDNFDIGFMGSFEARKNKWLVFTDLVYLNMSDEQPSTVPGAAPSKLDLTGSVLHLAGGYGLFSNGQSRLDLIAGARYFDLRIDASASYLDGGITRTFSLFSSGYMMDGIIGVKGEQTLTKNWRIPYYIDLGAGGSDLTWQVMAGINYRAANRVDISLMYRHIYWDLSPGTNAFEGKVDNITFSGPVLGAIFRF